MPSSISLNTSFSSTSKWLASGGDSPLKNRCFDERTEESILDDLLAWLFNERAIVSYVIAPSLKAALVNSMPEDT